MIKALFPELFFSPLLDIKNEKEKNRVGFFNAF